MLKKKGEEEITKTWPRLPLLFYLKVFEVGSHVAQTVFYLYHVAKDELELLFTELIIGMS